MNKFEEKLNQKELPKIDIEIVEPQGDKSWMLVFNAKTQKEAEIYNHFISNILSREDLGEFHQIGRQNEVGFHGWEIWKKNKVNKEILVYLKNEIVALIEKQITD